MQDWEIRVRENNIKNVGKTLAMYERQIFKWSYELEMQIRDGNNVIAKICQDNLTLVKECRADLIGYATTGIMDLTIEEIMLEAFTQHLDKDNTFKIAGGL